MVAMDIKLNDLLGFSAQELNNGRVKVKFNINNGCEEPIDVYKRNPDEINRDWLLWKVKRKYFRVDDIAICLVSYSCDLWLLTAVKRIVRDFNNVEAGINYEAEDYEKCKAFADGRVIVRYHKYHPGADRNFSDICDDLIISEVLPSQYVGDEFPGYDSVRLTFGQLKTIIARHRPDWVNALSGQKAVYLITDKETGKKYVGSATSQNGMLLARWTNYVNSGHGGNKELVRLFKEKGIEYIRNNFVYSILENYNARVDDGIIKQRESWWKQTLLTRQPFGYNDN